MVAGLPRDALGRLRPVSTEAVAGATKHLADFTYVDLRGEEQTARAKIYVPEDATGPTPLWYQAGYEVAPDELAVGVVRQGFVVVNPATPEPGTIWPGENPLGRSVNLDVALLHIARSLDIVDDTRVVLAGGSAGGYMALLLAAETFPLRAVMPQVAPLNWGYNAAYMLHNSALPGPPELPSVGSGRTLAQWGVDLLGPDTSSAAWFAHSPLAHVDEITCLVHNVYSTADMLVPVDQVARDRAYPIEGLGFPDGFSARPEDLPSGELGQVRLADVVSDLELHVIPLPEGAEPFAEAVAAGHTPVSTELPAGERQWTICILDEGPPAPDVMHLKYAVAVPRPAFVQRAARWDPDPDQATEAKLRVLAKRYAGEEWIDSPVRHLDTPEAERADVERAMRTFRSMPGGPEALQKLPPDLLASLP